MLTLTLHAAPCCSMTFSSRRSRWHTPALCACRMAAQACRMLRRRGLGLGLGLGVGLGLGFGLGLGVGGGVGGGLECRMLLLGLGPKGKGLLHDLPHDLLRLWVRAAHVRHELVRVRDRVRLRVRVGTG